MFVSALVMASSASHATPLILDYTIQDIGAGKYKYDFELVLDNHDATWVAGQQ